MKRVMSHKQKDFLFKQCYFNSDRIKHNNNKISSLQIKVMKAMHQCMISKYTLNESGYYKKKINELIYNQDSFYACLFKEFLIYEDENEFLKKNYSTSSVIIKLRNITVFYEKYSKMFPNYIKLPESTILYKNIQKKQKMIDKLQEMKRDEEKQRNNNNNNRGNMTNQGNIFHTTVNDSILNQSNSFAINVKYIYNYKEEEDEDSNINKDKSISLIEKIIEAIDEGDKATENLTSRREIVILNSKSKIFSAELSKIHQSQSPFQNKSTIKPPPQVQSGSSSSTSILSTNNNSHNAKDKAKIFEYKINQHLNGIAKINVAALTKLKKNTLIPSIISTPRQNYRSICSPSNNSSINQRSLIHSQSQSSYLIHNQFKNNISIKKGSANAGTITNNSLSTHNKSNITLSKNIMTHNKLTKLQKKYFEVEYFTHRSGKISGIDLLKVNANGNSNRINNDLNHFDSVVSPSGLLSESQQQKYLKCNFIRNNLSPVIRTNNNSPVITHKTQKSVINSQRILEENKSINQVNNGKAKLARKAKIY